MYDLPKFRHMTSPILACSQKMSQCTASVHIHRYLASGSCITQDPGEADLFFLPAYESCYNETACGFGDSETHSTQRCFALDFDPYADLPHFARRRGIDHFFLAACNLLAFEDPLMVQARHSIMVTVESFQAKPLAGPPMLAWLSYWKDVLIPGYIPGWRIDAMREFSRPMIKRNILLAFHGHSANTSSDKIAKLYNSSPLAGVRLRILEHFGKFNHTASVGEPIKHYFRIMGLSKFCLVPAGLTAWTIHLYEAFFFGCVPVILSDELTVPFQAFIDWPSLSLHVPTSISMEALQWKLETFSLGRLKAMHRELKASQCWFDYRAGWGEDDRPTACSPYRGLMEGLQARVQAGQAMYRLPPYWEPHPTT